MHYDCKEFAHSLQFINSLLASQSNLSWEAHKNLQSACKTVNTFICSNLLNTWDVVDKYDNHFDINSELHFNSSAACLKKFELIFS